MWFTFQQRLQAASIGDAVADRVRLAQLARLQTRRESITKQRLSH